MQQLQIENIKKIKKTIPRLEKKLKVRVSIKGGKLNIKGDEVNIFLAKEILEAVDFGFDIDDALLLLKEAFCLEFINIKEHTHRHNLKEVRSRVIGKKGKAMKTIEVLTGGVVVVHDNKVGLIVDSEHLESAIQGICSLIQGAKHGNVFSYLEKQKRGRRGVDEKDLGLREKKDSS